jgi:hypothetical protein
MFVSGMRKPGGEEAVCFEKRVNIAGKGRERLRKGSVTGLFPFQHWLLGKMSTHGRYMLGAKTERRGVDRVRSLALRGAVNLAKVTLVTTETVESWGMEGRGGADGGSVR